MPPSVDPWLWASMLAPGGGAATVEPIRPTEALDEEESLIRLSEINGGACSCEPMNVLGYGVSRKRLEQAIKDLQLPVVVVREPDEADVGHHAAQQLQAEVAAHPRGRGAGHPHLRAQVEHGGADAGHPDQPLRARHRPPGRWPCASSRRPSAWCARSPSRSSCRPQNAFVRKLQHRAAEAANLVTRSRGREPFRRVRVYPEKVRAWR